jgi:thiamine kinase-like enzyme
VSVFPFIDGWAYPEGGQVTRPDRAAVVDVLARLHEATPAARDLAGVDDLAVADRGALERALTELHVAWDTGPYAEATREVLASTEEDLRALLKAYDRLVDIGRTSNDAWVVTHGEPKADNLLATESGPMLVDWDTVLVAPAARDLWMLDGGTYDDLAAYTERTGRRVSSDQLLLYRVRWDLTDVASFVQWFRSPHEQTADTEIAWHALSQALRLRDNWPQLF